MGGSCEDFLSQSACFCFVVQALWLWQKPDAQRALLHVKKSYWYKLVGLCKRSASKWAIDFFSTAFLFGLLSPSRRNRFWDCFLCVGASQDE